MSLDPSINNSAQFAKLHAEELKLIELSNRLEPGFPYSQIPFKPVFVNFLVNPALLKPSKPS